MRFYTESECETWLAGHNRQKPDKIEGLHTAEVSYPSTPGKIEYFAHCIATTLTCRMPTLLWITEWGIWRANWHLYYRFRQSYGDQRLLHEAPGHMFLEFESEDLGSFLQLAMLNGWDGYVLTEANYMNTFFSHDEYVKFFASNASDLKEIQEALTAK